MKHLLHRLLLVLALGCLLSGSNFATNAPLTESTVRIPNLRFRSLGIRQGLPTDGVRALLQDSRGLMWLGTSEGLFSYDGKTFRHPSRGAEMKTGIIALAETEGCIWLGTDRGLYVYHLATDSISSAQIYSQQKVLLNSMVLSLATGSDGTLWAATYGQGIWAISPNSGTARQYFAKKDCAFIAQVVPDSENQIWAISNWHEGNGIARLNRQTETFETIFLRRASDGSMMSSPIGLTMMEDHQGRMWVGADNHEFFYFDRHSLSATTLNFQQPVNMQHIHSILEYTPGLLLIGSDDGLLAVDVATGKSRLFTDDASHMSLTNRFVYPMLLDHEGGLWVGTFYGGLCYASPRTGAFEAVPGHVISHFLEDEMGRIWMTSDDAGVICQEGSSQQFLLPGVNAQTLCRPFNNHELWVGTYASGIIVLDTRTGKEIRRYSTLKDRDGNALTTTAYAIATSPDGQVWIGTSDGVCCYDATSDCFLPVYQMGTNVVDIIPQADGKIWFCTLGSGVWRYKTQQNSWKNYVYEDTEKPYGNTVNSMYISPEGEKWIASQDGLCRYDSARDLFNMVLPCAAKSIVADRHLLWVTTSQGVLCYDTTGALPVRYFNDDSELIPPSFMQGAMLMTHDGHILAGTSRGFISFQPYRLQTNTIAPHVMLTHLEIANKPVPVGGELLDSQLCFKERLDLDYRQNSFAIYFASLSYASPEQNRYQYWLEGFDREWAETTSPKALYTNVPPGNYILHVRGSNNDGVWCDSEVKLAIHIHPPFYWNTASKLIYTLLVLGGILLCIKWFLERNKRQHEREMKQLAQHTEEQVQQAKMQFFTTIAHEIRTPVSLIIGPLEQILQQTSHLPLNVRTHLNIVARNSQRLLDLVNQLLDFRKVEQGIASYHFQVQALSPIIRSVVERFEPFVSQQGATIQMQLPTEELMAEVDAEALTKLVSNLMMNATKYTRTLIRVELRQVSANEYLLAVSDDGMGMTEEVRRRVFEPFYQANDNKPGTGIGLSIVQSIVQVHQGKITVESQVDKGSTFTVVLPFKLQYSPEGMVLSEQRTEGTPGTEAGADLDTEIQVSESQEATILLVDDNEELLSFLGGCISEHYKLLTATSAREALDLLAETHVTLIISDWMMPGMDGGQFCQAVRHNPALSHIPFILLTAKTDNASKIQGMDLGADTYIEKPFSVDYVLACIRNLLELRQMLRQSFASRPLTPVSTIASTPTDQDFVKKMEGIIEQNFSNPDLSVDFLARELGMSRSSLFAKIKALSGTTPNEMIQLIRLQKASQMLSTGKYHVAEVCYSVGFSSPSYFTKCFARQFGYKPTEFMAQQNHK